ncbi:MAG: adenylate/guanylate cyclase domain-containing protein [Pseudomonadota bacterium]
MNEENARPTAAATRTIADQTDRTFNRLTLAFSDPALERTYTAHHNREALGPLRVIIGIFIAVIILQATVELWGFFEEGWDGVEYWYGGLVPRLSAIALFLVGFWVTTRPGLVRYGQPLVGAFVVALYAIFLLGAENYGPWIMLAAMMFNYAISLLAVASGLLFRHAAPLVVLMAAGFAPVIASWVYNPFAPMFLISATAITMIWIAYSIERARRESWAAAQALSAEQALTESLLLNVLPPSIAKRMRSGETLIADSHDQATVVFADIVNFTPLSASMAPETLVAILDEVFTGWDRIADDLDLEKIKTIGDAYMMAAGLPNERSADPAHALDAAIRMRDWLTHVARARDIDISMRAGIHIGPVVAGVIGQSKFVYDLWGDSVNVASRMESTAPVGEIQVTDTVRDRLSDQFDMTERGEVEVKGKGPMRTWLLAGRKPI